MKPQAIAGVSAGSEREIETVYPSISAGAVGQMIGSLCDSIPVRICGIKLSTMLFALPLAPVAATWYIFYKILSRKYVLTNRSVKIRGAFSGRLFREVALADVDNIAIDVQGGQSFYHAGDIVLLKPNGDEISRLSGVVRPARFRQVILEARDARQQADASLAVLDARQPQPA